MTDQLAELAAAAKEAKGLSYPLCSDAEYAALTRFARVASPDRILALLAHIEAVTRDRDRLRGALLAVARIQLGFACWCPPSWGDGHTDACRGARAALGGGE